MTLRPFIACNIKLKFFTQSMLINENLFDTKIKTLIKNSKRVLKNRYNSNDRINNQCNLMHEF